MTPLSPVEHNDTELGHWTTYARPLHPALRRFVGSYQGYTQRVLSPGRHATAVTHMYPLIVSLDGRHTISPSDGPSHEATVVDSFLAGIYPKPVTVEATAFFGVQVELTPLGAYALLKGNLDEMSGQTVALDTVLGPPGRRFVEQAGNSSSWAERLADIEEILLTWFERAPLPRPEILAAWDSIVTGQGRQTIAEVATDAGWSRTHLARRMRRDLGISPKQLSRMVRFRHALNLMTTSPLSLGEIALAAGYFDQAHMNAEIKEFTGRSPGSFTTNGRRSHFSKT